MKKKLYIVVVALISIGLISIQLASKIYQLYELSEVGVTVDAEVVKLHCIDHASYYYSFEINGHSYVSYASGGVKGKKCSDLLGTRIPVTYSPDDPAVSAPGDIEARISSFEDELGFLGCVFLFVAAASVMVFKLKIFDK